jgi:purine-binding chemotaxis protein CheW
MSDTLISSAAGESRQVRTSQYLTFQLGGEEYGVNILNVEEIKSGDKITKIPKTPDYILGVMNLRGDIVPVVDLRERFQIKAPESLKHQVVIILNVKTDTGRRVVGVIIDDVSDVYDLSDDQIQPSPDLGNAISTEFIHGIATLASKIIIVLNSDRLFSMEELSKMADLEEALTS